MTTDKEMREAFELKYKNCDLRKNPRGVYENDEVDMRYVDFCTGFQAAYQLQQKRIDALSEFLHNQLTDLNQSRSVSAISYYKFGAYKEMEQFLLSQTKDKS